MRRKADSTGRCNDLVKSLSWRIEVQCFPRSFVKAPGHGDVAIGRIKALFRSRNPHVGRRKTTDSQANSV